VKKYVPYYELVIPPMMNNNDILMISVKVEGSGDYLPSYAGNLDIINCAAIKTMEYL
jgi:acetaldehyde dehydrogenase